MHPEFARLIAAERFDLFYDEDTEESRRRRTRRARRARKRLIRQNVRSDNAA